MLYLIKTYSQLYEQCVSMTVCITGLHLKILLLTIIIITELQLIHGKDTGKISIVSL